MQTKQKAYSEQRLQILEQVRLDSSINEANFYKVIKNTDQLKINGISNVLLLFLFKETWPHQTARNHPLLNGTPLYLQWMSKLVRICYYPLCTYILRFVCLNLLNLWFVLHFFRLHAHGDHDKTAWILWEYLARLFPGSWTRQGLQPYVWFYVLVFHLIVWIKSQIKLASWIHTEWSVYLWSHLRPDTGRCY